MKVFQETGLRAADGLEEEKSLCPCHSPCTLERLRLPLGAVSS